MLLFIVLLLLVVILLFLLIKFKTFFLVEYISWIHSLSNFLCVSRMQHKIHHYGKIPSLTWEVGNVFLTDLYCFMCCFFVWHLWSTSKAFYHDSIFFFLLMLSHNPIIIRRKCQLIFCITKNMNKENCVIQSFLCGIKKSNHSHDFISGAVHSFRASCDELCHFRVNQRKKKRRNVMGFEECN